MEEYRPLRLEQVLSRWPRNPQLSRQKDFLDAPPSSDLGKKCQAYLYAGTKRLIIGDKVQATDLLKKRLETDRKGGFEYASAKAELEALKKE